MKFRRDPAVPLAAVAAAAEQQVMATTDISRNVRKAAGGAQDVADDIAGVSDAARPSGEMAGDMLRPSQKLAAGAQGLRREVDAFLEKVQAA